MMFMNEKTEIRIMSYWKNSEKTNTYVSE